ncbi:MULTISPECIES: DUF1150 family protein [Ascidiaceihabitans]|uniref:DUF1150 domain-containing protein n=1 Tax=Ascidiaceihabitans donghaensis TaxID=1510460 RepID=A0A2R8BAS3_9RHOB|nr:DUF1150 family protein [Ascidiaceihabitans donghaensis]SPH20140.1 hypothetical protein ASD8599_00878 [Ascidiaceihabitans donghaensis]
MNTRYELNADADRMVYVKPVVVDDLPPEVRKSAGDAPQLFAVHASDGQQLALVADERLAYVLARQNDYAPQPLH